MHVSTLEDIKRRLKLFMKKIKDILEHIKQDALEIQDFINGIDENQFVINPLIRKAVCMSLINIGELVKTLPDEYKNDHSEILPFGMSQQIESLN